MKPPTPSTTDITALVSAKLGVSVSDINSRIRVGKPVHARQLVWYLANKYGKLRLCELGRQFKRNHTTVMHGINAVKLGAMSDAWWKSTVDYFNSIMDAGVDAMMSEIAASKKVAPPPPKIQLPKEKKEYKPAPVVAKPVVTTPAHPNGYRPRITRPQLAEIDELVDEARVDHRLMWFDFEAWKQIHRLEIFVPDDIGAAVKATKTKARKIEMSHPVIPTQEERTIYNRTVLQVAREHAVSPDMMMLAARGGTHAGRREAITKAVDAGVRYAALAFMLRVSVNTINKAVTGYRDELKRAAREARMMKRGAA